MKKLFLSICFILYLIPVCGQNTTDTLTKYGIYSPYDHALYNTELGGEIKSSDFVRGELDWVTKRTGISYKVLPQYFISEGFTLAFPPANPEELHRTAGNVFASKWLHEDGECILFIKCHGMNPKIDRSIDELPKTTLNSISYSLGVGKYFNVEPTEKEMKKIRKIITVWSPEKSKDVFNAQYVITYPLKDKNAVYMGKYTHKLELIMIKWGEKLSVSFLVTDKGSRNIKNYMKDVESAFRFND